MKKVVLFFAAILILCVMPGLSSAARGSQYDAALKSYYSGHYRAAVKDLKDYVNKRPDAAAYYLIGYGLYKLGKYKESTEYFDQAYLIDPTFSPEKIGFGKFAAEMRRKPAGKAAAKKKKAASKKAPAAKAAAAPAAAKQAKAEEAGKGGKVPAPAVPKTAPKVPATVAPKTAQKAPPPAPHKVVPEKLPVHPRSFPSLPKHERRMPGMVPALLTGLFAGFAMLTLAISIVIYIYWCLCLFTIAKKLDVPAPWTAWIPIVQVWPFVKSASKPWWWILLLLVPIVNIGVIIYLWICITENMRRNKWLGLLMIVPLVNLVFLGLLAFSEVGKVGDGDTFDNIGESSDEHTEPEPPDFPEDF